MFLKKIFETPKDKVLPFKIVNLEQGTQEWLEWRYTGIGASDSAVVLGKNKFKSLENLLHDKINKIDVKPNAKMREGTLHEPEARAEYQKTTDTLVQPLCIQSKSHPWMIASLDGLSYDYEKLVEIKCGESTYRKATDDIVPVFMDRVTIMDRGLVVRSDTPEKVLTDSMWLSGVKLELPQIAQLMELLRDEDKFPINTLPLTIGHARQELVNLVDLA